MTRARKIVALLADGVARSTDEIAEAVGTDAYILQPELSVLFRRGAIAKRAITPRPAKGARVLWTCIAERVSL